MTTPVPPLPEQVQFWNAWNARSREHGIQEVSRRQAAVVTGWLAERGRDDLEILDVGCGAGWLEPLLLRYGRVTATDLADDVVDRAGARCPQATFLAGDFMTLPLPAGGFDAVVTLEVLSHVADQPSFLDRIAELLVPGGELLLATQNRPVLQRYNRLPPPGPGQLRRWVDRHELAGLLAPRFEVLELFSVTPKANRGLMRVLHSRTVNRPVRAVAGDRVDRLKEHVGLGWTLMCRARRRADAPVSRPPGGGGR